MPDDSPEIERNLVLSTAHLTWQDSIILTAISSTRPRKHDTAEHRYFQECKRRSPHSYRNPFLPIVYAVPYGFYLFVGTGPDDGEGVDRYRLAGLSDTVVDAVKLCVKHGCKFLHYDADADVIDGLKEHEWPTNPST